MASLAATSNSTDALAHRVDELKQAWRTGACPDTAGALRDHPELLARRSLVIDLAYEEYCLREETGEAPEINSFCRKMPAYGSQLSEVLRGHRQMADNPELFENVDTPFPEPGDSFDGLKIDRELGRGAFARVYLVTDPRTGERPLVLKISRLHSAEGQMLGSNEHEHVVPIYSARVVEGLSSICMPFVGATTLRDVLDAQIADGSTKSSAQVYKFIDEQLDEIPFEIRRNPGIAPKGLSIVDTAVSILLPIARALAHLHRNGVSHGDLKPSNILLGPGAYPYLIDFNLASDCDDSMMRRGGTLAYMAPERVRGILDREHACIRPEQADIYSLGAVLFECLTGTTPAVPKNDNDILAVARLLLDGRAAGLPPIRRIRRGVSATLTRIVEACLNDDPSMRPSAEKVHRALKYYLHRRRRHAKWAVAGVCTIAVVTCLAVIATSKPGRAETPDLPAIAAQSVPMVAQDPFADGVEYLRIGSIAAATRSFTDAHRAHPDGRTTAYLAYCFARNGNKPAAMDFFEQAIAKGFAPPWVLNNLAFLISRTKEDNARELKKALELVSRARGDLRQDRAIAFNWVYVTYLLHQVNKLTLNDRECFAELERVLAIGPFDAELYFRAARVLTYAGESDHLVRAVECLTNAVELGKPAEQLVHDPLFRDHLSGRHDFEQLLSSPPPRRPGPPINLGLLPPVD